MDTSPGNQEGEKEAVARQVVALVSLGIQVPWFSVEIVLNISDP